MFSSDSHGTTGFMAFFAKAGNKAQKLKQSAYSYTAYKWQPWNSTPSSLTQGPILSETITDNDEYTLSS